MNTLSPFRGTGLLGLGLPELISQLDQTLGRADASGSTSTSAWMPRVDIRETPEAFVIHADVPGVSPDVIDVQLDKGMLTIKGERSSASESKTDMGVRMERTFGAFRRRFSLPDTADAEKVSATCEHGVLEVIVPKKAQEKPRRIQVGVRSASSQEMSDSNA